MEGALDVLRRTFLDRRSDSRSALLRARPQRRLARRDWGRTGAEDSARRRRTWARTVIWRKDSGVLRRALDHCGCRHRRTLLRARPTERLTFHIVPHRPAGLRPGAKGLGNR